MNPFVPSAEETKKAMDEIIFEAIRNGSGTNISIESLKIAYRVMLYHVMCLEEE